MANIYPVFIPHLACKNDCVFCNQKKISGTLNVVTPSLLHKKLLNENLSDIEIAFYGGSFTGLKKSLMIEYLEVANEFTNNIRLSTRPDYISDEILQILKKYNVSTIELGVQSLDDEVLLKCKRGHTKKDVYNASLLVKQYDFTLILQMMIGLPLDTLERSIATANQIVKLSPFGVRIYPVVVLPNTYLNDMLKNGEYTPLNLNEAVKSSALIAKIFINSNINIIRIGLHNEDGLEGDIIAGPFHPAFGELVSSKIYLDIIERKIQNIHNNILIYCSKSSVSKIVGHKKCNILYLHKKYNINIKVIAKENIEKYKIEIVGDFIE